jgi:PAS domain S-box-containing protein
MGSPNDRQAPVNSSGAGSGSRTPELQLLYETAPIGLAFLTPDCRYQLINRHLCEICGLSVDDHIGRSVRETVPQVAEQVENIVQTILRTGNSITGVEVSGQRPDGGNADRVWITNWHPLIAADGSILGINVASEEITERKRMEVALAASEAKSRELADGLRNLNELLEQRVVAEAQERVRIWDAARREISEMGRHLTMAAMVASIAHEISQPLTAVTLNATTGLQLLAKAKPDIGDMRAILKDIFDDGKRARAVLDGIRSMFRNDHGARTTVTVNELIGEVLAVVRGELDVHKVSLRSELSDGLPSLLAEPTQLRQVLLNLVMNAIEAMSSVTTRERVLIVKSVIGEPGYVQVTVEDTGSGIDPSLVDRVFEAFFTTKVLGMGMGLSICRSIVEAHGGLLSVSARRPNGSSFCVKLPTNAAPPVYGDGHAGAARSVNRSG